MKRPVWPLVAMLLCLSACDKNDAVSDWSGREVTDELTGTTSTELYAEQKDSSGNNFAAITIKCAAKKEVFDLVQKGDFDAEVLLLDGNQKPKSLKRDVGSNANVYSTVDVYSGPGRPLMSVPLPAEDYDNVFHFNLRYDNSTAKWFFLCTVENGICGMGLLGVMGMTKGPGLDIDHELRMRITTYDGSQIITVFPVSSPIFGAYRNYCTTGKFEETSADTNTTTSSSTISGNDGSPTNTNREQSPSITTIPTTNLSKRKLSPSTQLESPPSTPDQQSAQTSPHIAVEATNICEAAMNAAQSVGIIASYSKLVSSNPQQTNVRGRYGCIAATPSAQYMLTVDLICSDLGRPQCTSLYSVAQDDGSTLYQRR